MSTLLQIRSECYGDIDQTENVNSDFSTAEMNSLINEAVRFTSTLIDYPREFKEFTPVFNQADYDISASALTTNTLKTLAVYFGDKSIAGDLMPLRILTLEKIRGIRPNWLDESASTQGKPLFAIPKTKTVLTLHPRPDVQSSVAGKKVLLVRSFLPDYLTSDSEEPNLPPTYHELLKYYVSHTCYSGKLKNAELADSKLKLFLNKIKILQPVVDKEIEEGYTFGFIYGEGLSGNENDNQLTVW